MPGLIYEAPGGVGVTPLNPNGDAWSSVSTTGYATDDIAESEIAFTPLPVPYAEPTSDLVRGADCRFSDIVRIDEYDSGVYMATDGTNLMFRFRQGNTVPGSKGYSILIDSDGLFGNSGTSPDPNYIPKTTGINGNPGFEIEIVLETNFQVAIYDVDGRDGFTGGAPVLLQSYPVGTHHQRSVALTNNCDDPDYFHDFYVVLADLYATTGINANTPLRFAATTVMAPKPATGGPISDINGGGNYEEIVNYQCGTSIAGSTTNICSCTNPPTINGPIPSGSNVPISGNWSPTSPTKPNNATITFFVNGVEDVAASVTTTGGAGYNTTLAGPLVNGDTIYAVAQATGEGVCDPDPQILIVSDCTPGNTTPEPAIICFSGRGAEGTAEPNATITIYRLDVNGQTLVATVIADATGVWNWSGVANGSGGCGGGSKDVQEGSYMVRALSPGDACESGYSGPVCVDDGDRSVTDFTGATAAPTIDQAGINSSTPVISGTAVAGSLVRLYINNYLDQTVVASGAGTYSFNVSLAANDVVEIYAQDALQCMSAAATATVGCVLPAPSISSNDLGQVAAGSNLVGTSSEIGETINIYDDANPGVSLGTAVVQPDGSWSSGVVVAAGVTYYATVTSACGESDASLLATGIAPTPNRCGVFTNTPYNDQTNTVSGTLSSAVANTTVNLYIDGGIIGTTVTSTTTWSINVAGELYGGGTLTFGVQEAGSMEFLCSVTEPVSCAPPPAFTFTPSSLTISSQDGTATFSLSSTTAGVLYVVEDAALPNIDRGVSIFSTGADFDLVTFPFTQEGTYNLQIRGMTFNGVGCENIGVATVIVPDAGADSITNVLDIDDDDDGIPDVIEACGPNATDYSCIGSGTDPSFDDDGDGILNYQDPDYCTLNANGVCDALDADGDGIINQFDLDSDNDGIPDLVEVGGVDTNGDGILDDLTDTDGDGLMDAYDNDDTDGPRGTSPCSPLLACLTNSTSILFDTDQDGITDRDNDMDGDGIPNYLDLDADNDGIPDVVEANGVDTDGDGLVDGYTDTDGDGFADIVDGDVGNDGTIENTDNALQLTGIDTDNDGQPNSYPEGDFDGDGNLNYLDLDADNDGIPDVVEAGGTDEDGDGFADNYVDSDNDGYNDIVDGDVGNDGTAENSGNSLIITGTDTDGDGAPNSYTEGDFDADGDLNYLDLDADNDGIQDILEAYGTDANGDGMVDGYTDSDNDGYHDPVDGDVGNDGTAENTANSLVATGADANGDGAPDSYPEANADNRGLPNFLDLDSDNDGITDVVENASGTATGTGTSDSPGSTVLDGMIEDGGITDGNTDGWSDTQSGTSTIVDSDGDGIADPYDIDADNDGIPDYLEGTCSTCPSFMAPAGADLDGNGVLDMYESLQFDNTAGGGNTGVVPNEDDNDGAAPADYLDLDSDNDTGMDWAEGFDNGFGGATAGDGNAAPEIINMALAYEAAGGPAADYPNTDSDGDGLPDFLDNLVGFGYTNASPPPFLDPLSPFWVDADNDGLADLFDNEINGNAWGTTAPVPDNDALDDRDWRDINTYVDLPVELLSFEAERSSTVAVRLNWATASELNNKGFFVERMLENQSEFTTIGWVDGAGTTSMNMYYEFTDDNSYSGISYYRIRQVDFDGTEDISVIRAVNGSNLDILQDVSVFPQPANEEVHIRFGALSASATTANLQIVDLNGRVLLEADYAVAPFTVLSIDEIQDWPAATYIINIKMNNGATMVQKFIKK